MLCANCQSPQAEGAKFCSSCGKSTTKKSGANKAAVVLVAVLLAIIVIATVFGGRPSPSRPATRTARPDASPDASPVDSAAIAKANAASAAQRQKRLAELKSHFVVTEDEFEHFVTIRHKAFSKFMNGNGTTIAAEIVNNSLLVESEFVSEDWIFHETFTVKVGAQQLSAEGKTQHEVVNGIVETVSPTSADSLPIAELIAHAGNQPVRVRLEGKFYKDYTLRPAHQKAIAETVEYFHLLGN